ncbi:MAG: hypothetical protein ACOYJG_00435 [Prevotella sp.]|jgi:DNA-binding NtrC family response regulator
MKTLQVLVLDSASKLSAEYLFNYSPHKFQLVTDVESAIERMQSTDYNMVVVDSSLTDKSELELLRSMVTRQLPEALLTEVDSMDNKSLMRLVNQTAAKMKTESKKTVNVMDGTFELQGLRTK